MSLERIVRPALPGDTSPPKQVRSNRTAQNWNAVILRYGIGGSVKTMSGSYSMTGNLYAIKKPKEDKSGSESGSFLDGVHFP
jgi:hypothetical protein